MPGLMTEVLTPTSLMCGVLLAQALCVRYLIPQGLLAMELGAKASWWILQSAAGREEHALVAADSCCMPAGTPTSGQSSGVDISPADSAGLCNIVLVQYSAHSLCSMLGLPAVQTCAPTD
jgi:hypothetical protein